MLATWPTARAAPTSIRRSLRASPDRLGARRVEHPVPRGRSSPPSRSRSCRRRSTRAEAAPRTPTRPSWPRRSRAREAQARPDGAVRRLSNGTVLGTFTIADCAFAPVLWRWYRLPLVLRRVAQGRAAPRHGHGPPGVLGDGAGGVTFPILSGPAIWSATAHAAHIRVAGRRAGGGQPGAGVRGGLRVLGDVGR